MRGISLSLVPVALLAARGAFATTAADIPCSTSSPAPLPCVVVSNVSVANASILDFGTRGLTISSAGQLDAGGGGMTILAASLVVQGGGVIVSKGGTIDVTTTGDARIELAGTAKGKIDVSGDNGGIFTLVAGGDLLIAGQLLGVGNLASGNGGSIDVTGTNVTLSGKISAGSGPTAFGGDVSVSGVNGGVTISGTIDTSAGSDGGTISVDADGDVTLTANALFNASAGGGGSADSVDITSYSGNISLAGVITAHAPGSLVNGGGSGADISVDASRTITNNAFIDVSGGGLNGLAGSLSLGTDGDIIQRGAIDASAEGNGGYAGLLSFTTSVGTVDIGGNDILADGPGSGADISAFSFNGVRVANRITADGPGAVIDLEGCAVDVLATAKLSSVGAAGANTLHASGQMTIAGTLLADPIRHCGNDKLITCTTDADCHFCQTDHHHLCLAATDCGGAACDSTAICASGNTLEYRDPTELPLTTGAVITPPAVQVLNPALIVCGGPPTTTTTTSTSTTTVTDTTTTTTATTTTVVTTSTTAATTPPTTTSTTTITSTTTSTTATTTTRVPSSTSTTSTTRPPTTTTTLHPTTCDPPDCNDGNACTDDSCDPQRGCVHTDHTGFDAITCRLEMIAGVLKTAAVGDVGGPATRGRFEGNIAKVQHMVDVGRSASGKRQVAKLKRANKLLAAFIHTVEKGEHRGKVKGGVGKQMTDLASGAQSSLLPYIL